MCVEQARGVKVETGRLLEDSIVKVQVRDDAGLDWGDPCFAMKTKGLFKGKLAKMNSSNHLLSIRNNLSGNQPLLLPFYNSPV